MFCPKIIELTSWDTTVWDYINSYICISGLQSLKYILFWPFTKNGLAELSGLGPVLELGGIYKKCLSVNQTQRICELKVNLLVCFPPVFLEGSLNRASPTLDSKVPEEYKLVTWRFIGSHDCINQSKGY